VCTKTLQAGGNVQTFVDSLTAGQVGCLRGGSYSGAVTINNPGVTLQSTPGERASITSAGTFTVQPAASGVKVDGLNIAGTAANTLTVRWYGDNGTLTRTDVSNNHTGTTCLFVGGSNHTTLNLHVTLSKIHACGALNNTLNHGVYAGESNGLVMTDDLVYDVGSYAIQLYPQNQNTTLSHLVIDGGTPSVRGGVVIDTDGSVQPTGERVDHSVISYAAQTAGIVARAGSTTATSNCFWQNAGGTISPATGVTQSGNVTADPAFANRTARDYRLGLELRVPRGGRV
jgi:hypothetical protein